MASVGTVGGDAGERYSWRTFEAWARGGEAERIGVDTEWFNNDLDDYGIVALSPDGRRIAVLAATHTG
ncbi:DUF6183 family protein [Streptomyces yerevanensis]|uniref:DUF6183 family protein n=1 Tax=Streptomyces yerevanensis TaxID=66378 RepID=UPI000523FA41|nr:DUF6183 family protein [Streptomyces yerevanensis]